MENAKTPRREERKLVEMAAACRTNSGLRDNGWICDISAEGCCVRSNFLFFRVGTGVVIRPPGMEGLPGTVRWIEGDRAGVEFTRPLHGAVVDHLASMYRDGGHVGLNPA